MNPEMLKGLDRLVGPVLARLLRKRRAVSGHPAPLSLLVVRPGGIGDAVLLVPALRALQAAYPGCRIDLLAERRNAAAFLLVPGIRTVYRYDTLSGLAAVLLGSYDLVIDTEQWYRLSALLARLIRAPRSIGFAGNERAGLFTDTVRYDRKLYEACSFFRLLEPLGIPEPATIGTPFLTLSAASAQAAERLVAPLRGKPFVALFPGASIREKQWGSVKFRELVGRLAAAEIKVVIVGGEDCCRAGEEIAGDGLALNLAGRASLSETAALLGKGRVLVSGDSGLLHIAAGLGRPTVSLFGPSDPGKWSPKGERHVVFGAHLPCAPCSQFGTIAPCARHTGCLDQIAPSEVADAVVRLWKRYPDAPVPTPPLL
jgi:lipopolysaccharide heptosyltransferase II